MLEADIVGARNAGQRPIWKDVSHWPEVNDDVLTVHRFIDNPVVLVRLSRVDRDALRDLLAIFRRLALANTRRIENCSGQAV